MGMRVNMYVEVPAVHDDHTAGDAPSPDVSPDTRGWKLTGR